MTPVQIDIASDIVCPWCFVGRQRLARALDLLRAEDQLGDVQVRWLPFFLNPSSPPEGEPYRPFLQQKFGSMAAVEALWARVREAGQSVGVEFAFDNITVRPNTLQAHRLLHWAQRRGDADALVERLFVAHFQSGEHIGDSQVLSGLAAECGYPAGEVAAYLASDEDVAAVRELERQVRARGIRSVPTFIFDDRTLVSGAETPELLAAALRGHLDSLAA